MSFELNNALLTRSIHSSFFSPPLALPNRLGGDSSSLKTATATIVATYSTIAHELWASAHSYPRPQLSPLSQHG